MRDDLRAKLNDIYVKQLELLQSIAPGILNFEVSKEVFNVFFDIKFIEIPPLEDLNKIKELLAKDYLAVYDPIIHSLGFTNKIVYRYVARIRPSPTETILPPPMMIPVAISVAAMAVLQQLYQGNEITVKWVYRAPYFEIKKGHLSDDMIAAIMNELTRQSEGTFFDGYMYHHIAVTQHVFITVETIETNEDYVLDKITLNDEGKKRVEAYQK